MKIRNIIAKTTVLAALATGFSGLASSPALALSGENPEQATPNADITVTLDPVACVATVKATWEGPTGIGFVQVNVDGAGVQEDATTKTLSLPGGDGAYPAPGSKTLTFTLPDGQTHVIDVWTALTNTAVNHVFDSKDLEPIPFDCREVTPPTIVEVPVEKLVTVTEVKEVVRQIPVVVERVVTKIKYRKVNCEHRRNKAGDIVIVKGSCGPQKKAKKRPAAKKPGSIVSPRRTRFTG